MRDPDKKADQEQTAAEASPREAAGEFIDPSDQKRKQFGAFVLARRTALRNPRVSQAEAAKKAGITRETWNRIERGKQLPDPVNIPAIAETLKVGAERLFTRAGYDVPLDLQVDTRKKLIRDFLACWDESTSAAQFLFGMLGMWLIDKLEDEKYRRIFMDVGFNDILLAIQQNLTRPQQLRLAAELIQKTPVTELSKERIDACKLIEEIDTELDRIKRIEANSLGGLYEIRSLEDMGQYYLLINDEDLTDALTFLKSRSKK
jgi:transcriptional regulator with XRE-family HTH domain